MRFRYLDGLALGLTLGFLVSTGTLWILDSTRSVVQIFLKEHLTHFFTLGAAALALWGVSRQIQSNVEMLEKTRLAKLDAAKSSLPIVLSNIVAISKNRCEAITNGINTKTPSRRWDITDFELSVLRDTIEYASPSEKYHLQQIIRIYQVLISRWEGKVFVNFHSSPVLKEGDYRLFELRTLYQTLLDWIILEEICNSLFKYSRGNKLNFDPNAVRENIFRTLEGMGAGSGSGTTGLLLINHKNYSDFVGIQRKKNKVAFLDQDWK